MPNPNVPFGVLLSPSIFFLDNPPFPTEHLKLNSLNFKVYLSFKIIKLFLNFMNNIKLIIYRNDNFYEILDELNSFFKFDLIKIESEIDLKSCIKDLSNYLVISRFILNYENVLLIDNFPIKIDKLIEKININVLKNNFNSRSKIIIGKYLLDDNSRKIIYKDTVADLTEQEVKVLLYLKKFNDPVRVEDLQKNIWGYNKDLETHTVETHIYRLRKKFAKIFKDNDFILSTKTGYFIK